MTYPKSRISHRDTRRARSDTANPLEENDDEPNGEEVEGTDEPTEAAAGVEGESGGKGECKSEGEGEGEDDGNLKCPEKVILESNLTLLGRLRSHLGGSCWRQPSLGLTF